jgi:hypothetical protein
LIAPMKSLDDKGTLLSAAATQAARFTSHVGLPVGGMGAVSQAMARSAESAGAHIRTGADVRRILVADSRVAGVELADGQQFRAGTVLSNAHPKITFERLLEPGAVPQSTLDSVRAMKTDSASMKFHAVVSELPDFTAGSALMRAGRWLSSTSVRRSITSGRWSSHRRPETCRDNPFWPCRFRRSTIKRWRPCADITLSRRPSGICLPNPAARRGQKAERRWQGGSSLC